MFIKSILISLLFTVITVAQTIDSVYNGTIYGSYELNYDVGKLKGYNSNTTIKRIQQNVSVTQYSRWGIGSISDSSLGNAVTPAYATEDTTYVNDISILLSNGKWYNSPDSNFITPLSAPTALDVNIISNLFSMSWDDNSSRELRYIIQRDTSGGSTWADIDTTAADIEYYIDSSITVGTYKYRVCAERNNRSGYSNISERALEQQEYSLTLPANVILKMDSVKTIAGFVPSDIANLVFDVRYIASSITMDANRKVTLITDELSAFNFIADNPADTANAPTFINPDTLNFWTDSDNWLEADNGLALGTTDWSIEFTIRNTNVAVRTHPFGLYGGSTDEIKVQADNDIGIVLEENAIERINFSIASNFMVDDVTYKVHINIDNSDSAGCDIFVDGVNYPLSWNTWTADHNFDDGNYIAIIGDSRNADYTSFDGKMVEGVRMWKTLLTQANVDSLQVLYENSADSVAVVAFTNISGLNPITVSAITLDDSTVFTIVDTLNYPFEIANDGTVNIELIVDRDQSNGVYTATLTVAHDGSASDQTVPLQVTINATAEWDYASDFSVDVDGWITYGGTATITPNIDGISDGVTSKNNVMRIVVGSGDAYHGMLTDFMNVQVGKRFEVQYTYLIPNSGNIPSINFAGAGGGLTLHSGSRSSTVTELWTMVVFDVTFNDSYTKEIVSGWDAGITPDSFYISDVKWREVIEDVSDTTAPVSPSSLAATGFNTLSVPKTYVNLSHPASVTGDVAYYTYWRGDTEGEIPALGWDSIGTNTVGTEAFQDTIPIASDEYDYYVTATDDSSNISWTTNPSDSALVPAGATIPPPTAPSALVVTGGLFKFTLDWTDNSDNEDKFYLYKDDAKYDSVLTNIETYVDTPIAHNTYAEFYVTAYDDILGESSASNTDVATTIDTTTYGEYVYGANAYFVSLNGAGLKDGTFGNDFDFPTITWTNIGTGDTLFFDGGIDSVVYPSTFNIGSQGNANGLLVIRPRWDVGHTGRVIIDLNYGGTPCIDNIGDYTRVEKLEGTRSTGRTFEINRGYNVVYIDSCRLSQGRSYHLYANNISSARGDSLFLRYSQIIFEGNYNGQTDGMQLKYTTNVFLDHNLIYIDNRQGGIATGGDQHIDCIQWFASTSNIYVTNNTLINMAGIIEPNNDLKSQKASRCQVMMTEGTGGVCVVYNNLIIAPYNWMWSGNFNIKQDGSATTADYYILNNTFLGGSNIASLKKIRSNSIVKNNLFQMWDFPGSYVWGETPENFSVTIVFANDLDGGWSDLDGNFWGDKAYKFGSSNITSGLGSNSMSGIYSAGGEQSGNRLTRDRKDPLFINYDRAEYYTNWNLRLDIGSPALNNGADIQTLVESLGLDWKDKDGNVRDSTPNCGAY